MLSKKNHDSDCFDIVVSILNFTSEERTLGLLSHIVLLFHERCAKLNLSYKFIIRDNSPDKSVYLKGTVKKLADEGLSIDFRESQNVGFGKGHNLNFSIYRSRIFCTMNNDMAFPHVDWLDVVASKLQSESLLAAVGIEQENYSLNPEFGFAHRSLSVSARTYLDGSVLFFNSHIFEQCNGFDENFGLAYFEDTDLSFRMQSKGYAIDVVDIPHQHFRSSSTQSHSSAFYSSVYEKGRSMFYCRWGNVLRGSTFNNKILIACDHDGIGDFFISIFPLRAFIKHAHAMGFEVSVILKHSDLAFLLADLAPIILFNRPSSISHYGQYIRLSGINFAIPFLSSDLSAALLGMAVYPEDEQPLKMLVKQAEYTPSDETGAYQYADQGYVVCHFDNTRLGFEGRVINRSLAKSILKTILDNNKTVVLVGSPDHAEILNETYEDYIKSVDASLLDLRGKTTIKELTRLISRAEKFIGIDSGPANIAQAFNVPALVVFGCISAGTKLYRDNSIGVSKKNLDCLGCYHSNVEPAYNKCYRLDEACMTDIRISDIQHSLQKFLSGDLIAQKADGVFRKRQREDLIHLIYNPLYKSSLLSSGNLFGKGLADTVSEIVGVISSRALSEAIHIKDGALELEKQNREQRSKLAEYEKLLAALSANYAVHVSGSNTSTFFPNPRRISAEIGKKEVSLLEENGRWLGCVYEISGGNIKLRATSRDPQLHLAPIYTDQRVIQMHFEGTASCESEFRVYWRLGDAAYDEESSTAFPVGVGYWVRSCEIPAARAGQAIALHIRLDPLDGEGSIDFSFKIDGEYDVAAGSRRARRWKSLLLGRR